MTLCNKAAVLTIAQMRSADQAAIRGGTASTALMEAAGMAVALAAVRHLPRHRRVLIACGPGNNGGDGLAAACFLQQWGWSPQVAVLGTLDALSPDAAFFADQWQQRAGQIIPLSVKALSKAESVIDALFGAGLSRPLEGMARTVVEAINWCHIPCLAVDVPSGVFGDTGEVTGVAPQCVATATFFRLKPAHCLYPARGLMGAICLADIGISEEVLLNEVKASHFINGPALWQLPSPTSQDHKYTRGHALILGGEHMTGAGRLAVRAARRVGAGLVTIAAPAAALPVYAADAPGALHVALTTADDFAALLRDTRRNALLIGPGAGVSADLEITIKLALAAQRPCVLDADALMVFAGRASDLAALVQGPVILTPHEGEFARLFSPIKGDKVSRARQAARESGCIIVLKGADTVIAAPDGRVALTINAPADLATAGSGDVLAGIIVGLLAQGLSAFDAAAAGVWLHGEAGRACGPGLIAEDLPEALPSILSRNR